MKSTRSIHLLAACLACDGRRIGVSKHGIFVLLVLLMTALRALAATPADTVYRNGTVYTVDANSRVQEALAVRAGRIVFVGSNADAAAMIGPATVSVDLHGRVLMPGIIDAHMHPRSGGALLLKCSLHYESLSVEQFQARIQACIDNAPDQEPDGWLEVASWFQQSMLPAGVETTRATLDALETQRPVIVRSSFGHSVLANTRALELAGFDAATPDPAGGKIIRDGSGNPTGLLEDAAFDVFASLLPQHNAADNEAAAQAALKALRAQGVTSFLDAAADQGSIAAFSAVQQRGELTARAHFAPEISTAAALDPQAAVAAVVQLVKRYHQPAAGVAPGITVRNAKLFLDGVISAPAFTGAMLAPYFVNAGSDAEPRWVEGHGKGPDVYVAAPALKSLLIELARAGIDPHMHADGDRAVRAALDAVAAMRTALPHADIRPAIAHNEIVDPADFSRFARLAVIPVLSFQWGKPAPDTVEGARDYLGPARARLLEPSGLLAQAGARIAFGSDWPVDALDEWFALKVGVTRSNSPATLPHYAGRLGADPGLSVQEVLRAATLNAAHALHIDDQTGSLEVGKFADLIVLDANPLTIPAERIADIKVLQTVLGGRVVYAAE